MRLVTTRVFCLALFICAASSANASGFSSLMDGRTEAPTTAIRYEVERSGTSGRGEMTFSGSTLLTHREDQPATAAALTFEATFDCVRVNGTDTLMSGSISSASLPEYLGAPVWLAVRAPERNDGTTPPLFTWGIVRPVQQSWLPSDAERSNDRGASYRWLATDAERLDDRGVASDINSTADCRTIAFDSLEFSRAGAATLTRTNH